MNNYQYPYNNQLGNFNPLGAIQQMFPSPQGSVYSIQSPLDIGNVPIGGTGLSVALCLAENLMYIKSFQNGNPVIMAYRIEPYTRSQEKTQTAPAPSRITNSDDRAQSTSAPSPDSDEKIDALTKRIAAIEEQLTPKTGGKLNELL